MVVVRCVPQKYGTREGRKKRENEVGESFSGSAIGDVCLAMYASRQSRNERKSERFGWGIDFWGQRRESRGFTDVYPEGGKEGKKVSRVNDANGRRTGTSA